MNLIGAAGLAGLLALPAAAAERSGKATVEWIGHSLTALPAQALPTGIRMVLDAGSHAYWSNPGEAGMETAIEWRLPEGWSAGEGLLFPVPERFSTGELAGFGYEDAVVFPVLVTPPPEFKGTARLEAKLSWLTCDDRGCVPGEAVISLELSAGKPSPTGHAPAIRDALAKVPRPPENGWIRLEVTQEKPNTLRLEITTREGRAFDPGGYQVFPATPQVIDPAAEIRFVRDGERWTAEVPKSAYAESPVKGLTLVLAGRGAEKPVELAWRKP